MQASQAAQFAPERVSVELPVKQNGARPVVSFVPIERGELFAALEGVPTAGASEKPATTTLAEVQRALDKNDETYLAILGMAQTEPRFTANGADGSVRWGFVRKENQDALIQAVMVRCGLSGADLRGARFLDDSEGTASGT